MTDPAPVVPDQASAPEPPPQVAADMTSGAAAFVVLRAQYAALRAEEPAVRAGDDTDALHRMRVALRRLRAALALFDQALPVRAAVHRSRLDRIGSALSPVRDMDVQLAQIATWAAAGPAHDQSALEAVARVLAERRAKAHLRAVAVLGWAHTLGTFEKLERFLANGPVKRSAAAQASILDLAPEILEKEYRKIAAIGSQLSSDISPEALHALRIRLRRLRYAVEFLEPLYGKAARKYVERLVTAQDLLGAHQDAAVTAATLHDVALERKRRFAADEMLVLGALIERCQERARTTREVLPDRYGKVTGRRWRRLMRAVEDARAERADLELKGGDG